MKLISQGAFMAEPAENTDPYLLAALEGKEEEVANIVEQIQQEMVTQSDRRDVALVSSGFALGWEAKKEAAVGHGTAEVVEVRELTRIARVVDDAMSSGDISPEAAALIQAPLASFIRKKEETRRADIRVGITLLLGTTVADALMAGPPFNDDAALDIGLAMAMHDSNYFYGFVCHYGDERIRCQCPQHLAEAYSVHRKTKTEAEKKALEKFGSKIAAFTAFGRWYGGQISAMFALKIDAVTGGIHEVDAGAADHLARGIFSRLMRGGPDGDDTEA